MRFILRAFLHTFFRKELPLNIPYLRIPFLDLVPITSLSESFQWQVQESIRIIQAALSRNNSKNCWKLLSTPNEVQTEQK